MWKITEQALYGHDKSFANSGSDSCGVSTCHRRWQAKFNGALTLGVGLQDMQIEEKKPISSVK